jgi:hypothetical protein
MFIALRDCVYDEDEEGAAANANATAAAAAPVAPVAAEASPGAATPTPIAVAAAAPVVEKKPEPPPEAKAPELDLDALERAAEAKIAQSAAAKVRSDARKRGAGRYKQTIPAESKRAERPSKMPDPHASIFNGQVLRSKSLDEVILSYLADDSSDEK